MHVTSVPSGRNSYSPGAKASPGRAQVVVSQPLSNRTQPCEILESNRRCLTTTGRLSVLTEIPEPGKTCNRRPDLGRLYG